jgi:hypothetical protein
MENSSLTFKQALGLFCADVDIFLLCEEDQTTTKNEVYTAEQIREQLHKSCKKFARVLNKLNYDIDSPLLKSESNAVYFND